MLLMTGHSHTYTSNKRENLIIAAALITLGSEAKISATEIFHPHLYLSQHGVWIDKAVRSVH